jgi:hypothetical protein
MTKWRLAKRLNIPDEVVDFGTRQGKIGHCALQHEGMPREESLEGYEQPSLTGAAPVSDAWQAPGMDLRQVPDL